MLIARLCLVCRSYGEDMSLEIDEWLSVLSLSSMWGFTKIRSAAIERLQSVDIGLVTKVRLPYFLIAFENLTSLSNSLYALCRLS